MKMQDKKHVKNVAKRLGLYPRGDFFIGTRNKDVLAGLAVDSAPSSTYVWNFVLPAFDEIPFLHMSLGDRAFNLSLNEENLESRLKHEWSKTSLIKQADQIISYIDDNRIGGDYAKWTRFICLIRVEAYNEAVNFMKYVDGLQSAHIPRKLREISELRNYGGWPAVQDLLLEWSGRTNALLASLPLEI